MRLFEGRVAIVTGASSGIGAATAQRLAQEGAAVFAIDRNSAGMETLHEKYAAIVPHAFDVTDPSGLQHVVNHAIEMHDKIDILVNCAGFAFYARHVDSTLEEWRQTQAVNIEAMYVLAKLVVPHMAHHKYGRIVNVSSIQANATDAVSGAYAASKGAIEAWSRSLAVDLAEHNILVNVVAPGCIHTAMSIIDGVDETTEESFQQWYIRNRKIPLARPGEANEVAGAICFLAGDQCTYITGHTLVVDGGLTITF